MLIQPNTPPAELPPIYDFVGAAERAHQLALLDFPTAFDHFFATGWVFKAPHYLLIGGHDPVREDAWLVWWAEMHPAPKDPRTMLRVLLRLVPYHKPYIAWARALKGRPRQKYYSTARLLAITKAKPSHNAPLRTS